MIDWNDKEKDALILKNSQLFKNDFIKSSSNFVVLLVTVK